MEEFLQAIQPLWCPHEGQRAFLVQPARLKVLACGRRWGKTEVCAIQIVFALTRKVPTKHIILAPTLDQAKLIFDRVVEFLHLMPTVPAGLLFQCDWDKAIKVTKSPHPKLRLGAHTVVARSGHLGRSLRGNEATHIVVDEAAYVPEELITEVAMPMLATTDGHLTMISTPHGLNHFWRFFQMGQRGEHGIWSRRAPSAESPHVRREFLEVQKALISSRAFRVEYEAEFLDSSGQVFRTESVEACIVPRLTSPPQPPYSIGSTGRGTQTTQRFASWRGPVRPATWSRSSAFTGCRGRSWCATRLVWWRDTLRRGCCAIRPASGIPCSKCSANCRRGKP